jgi:hypothetical protein
MMSNTNTGGPAFPHQWDHGSAGIQTFSGMTLRDYFAAKAMQVFLQNERSTQQQDAEAAYQMADAMLKAREAK